MSFDPEFDNVLLMMPLNPRSSVSEAYMPTRGLTVINKVMGVGSSANGIKNYPANWVYIHGNYVELDNGSVLNLKDIGFTAEAWIKLSTPGTSAAKNLDSQYIVRCYENYQAFTNDVILGVDTQGRPFAFLGNAGVAVFATGENSLAANEWFHLALSFNNLTKKLDLYVNGELAATNTANATNPAYFRFISLFRSSAGVAQIIDGSVQDVRITKSARYSANFTPPGAFQILTEGTVTRADGLMPAPVALFRSWPDMKTLKVTPDASGNWSAWLANCKHDVTYIADGAAPVSHGLYEIG